jgi:hypothetical protein
VFDSIVLYILRVISMMIGLQTIATIDAAPEPNPKELAPWTPEVMNDKNIIIIRLTQRADAVSERV